MLSARFATTLNHLGMTQLKHPLFYHAPVGIRFEIGGNEPVYLKKGAEQLTPNPTYIQNALDRATAIYRNLPSPPNILRIDGHLDEGTVESLLAVIRQRTGLPAPNEQIATAEMDEDGDMHSQVQFYWNLRQIAFQPEQLLQEILLGDIGGWPIFVSSVYLTGPGPYLYHLYNDRGLDVLGSSQDLLLFLYQQFHDWILEYDREKIGRLFMASGGIV